MKPETDPGGWVRLYRSLYAHEFADETWDRITAWMYLVSLAAYKPHDVVYRRHVYHIERGQTAIVMSDFGQRAGWSKWRVKRFFDLLVKKSMIEVKSDSICCVLTILNYAKYQSESAVAPATPTATPTATANDCPILTIEDIPATASATAAATQTKNALRKVQVQEQREGILPLPKLAMTPETAEVLAYLNQKVKRNFRNPGDIPARLKDYSVADCKKVIDKKCREWLGTKFAKNLDPVALFRPCNFDRYLNQVDAPNPQRGVTDVHAWDNVKGW